jgi:hypothetical protein
MSAVVGGLLAIENGIVRGSGFTITCFIFLTLYSYYTYKKKISKHGKRDIT